MSTRIYPDFEDGSCDFVNTSELPPRPPSARPLCRMPCAQRDFDTILLRGTVARLLTYLLTYLLTLRRIYSGNMHSVCTSL